MVKITERSDGTRRVSLSFSDAVPRERSRTRPEFYKDADMNRIIAKYRKTRILGDPLSHREGSYGDFSSGEDFAETMRRVVSVQALFNDLPSNVRTRFGGNPKAMIDFLVDPRNDEEAIKLGLKVKPVVVPPPAA